MDVVPSCPGCQALLRRIAELEQRVEELTRLLEEARRAGKRQAAPFSKKPPQADPKKPGRKPGDDYGVKAHRLPPKQIDEVHEAPLPDACPHCSGPLQETDCQPQYQTEIPRRPIQRQFNVHIGWCPHCARRVQGRHPLQTSNALGAAAAQLGPDAQAAAVELQKRAGLSHGKVVRCFETLFGIRLSRGGSAHVILRVARRCEPVYALIRQAVRTSPAVVPDETGWRIGGRRAWLHVLVGVRATCYVILRTRDLTAAALVLGLDYAGQLVHDGWGPYNGLIQAQHQQCLQHLLRRCRELLETARGGAVRFPRQVMALLGQALDARDRHEAGTIGRHGLAIIGGRLHNRLVDLAWPRKTHADNERLAAFLWKHQESLFRFLRQPGLDATNYRAEQALRPAVVNRKVWGGNRTCRGAEAQAILMSVLETYRQRGLAALDHLSRLLRAWPRLLPLPP